MIPAITAEGTIRMPEANNTVPVRMLPTNAVEGMQYPPEEDHGSNQENDPSQGFQ